MPAIRCVWLEPTDRVRRSLRRYVSSVLGLACPLPASADGTGYHNAMAEVDRVPAERDPAHGTVVNDSGPAAVAAFTADPRWPARCACGFAFRPEDERQVFIELLYRRADTGEETTLRAAPVGAMWYAPWMDGVWRHQLAHTLMVRLPGGVDWMPDMAAQNCGRRDDPRQEQHHCWVVKGVPPDITVGKDGPTCSAGAGSIAVPGYHGFLRGGWLTEG